MKHALKLAILMILLTASTAWGATYTVATSTTTVTQTTGFSPAGTLAGGDTVVLDGGARGNISFQGIDGGGSYITITNEDATPDAKVVITTGSVGPTYAGLELRDCKYIDLKGNNDADLTYGIKVICDGTPVMASAVRVRQECDHIKIGYIETAFDGNTTDSGNGIFVQDTSLSSAWIYDTFEIHHNYIHDTRYAGMYLGHNTPLASDNPYIANFSIHDNLLEDLGSYGTTTKGVHTGSGVCLIYNNIIRGSSGGQSTGLNPGTLTGSGMHGLGVQYFAGSTYANIYNNRVEYTVGPGLKIGDQMHNVYNNLILGCGTGNEETWGHGIVTYNSADGVEIYQNTILESTRYGIYAKSGTLTGGVELRDNIIAESGVGEWDEEVSGDATEASGVGANTYDADVDNILFTTWSDDGDYSNDDFSLQSGSPAVDAGAASGYPSTDYIGTVRPQGAEADDGAYEYIPSGSPPPSSDWGRKCELVIQNGQVPGNLSSYPVLITAATLPEEMIDSDHVDYAANQAQADAGDLRFYTDSAGTNRIACDIVDFTQGATPTVEIWVKVPSVLGASDTSIWVYYNATTKSQPAADAAYGSEAVWTGHRAGWHFEEADAGDGTIYYDSTSNNNDGTLTDADGDSIRGTGQVGASLDLNGDADFVNAGTGATLEMGLADWTLSCWVKMAAGENYILEKGAAALDSEGYNFWYYGTSDDLRGYLSDGATRITGDSNDTLALDDSTWRFIAVTFDRDGYATFYSDSGGTFAADGTDDISGFDAVDITNAVKDLRIGRYSASYSATAIDELRISNTLRSSDWLTASYNNQKTPATFIIEGTPENTAVTDTTRPTITDMGWWDAATNTCVTDKSITYTSDGDVIPLCLICDEALSIEVPGIESSPTLTVKPGPLTADTGTTTYAGYDNSGAVTIIKLNYIASEGDRATDLQAAATSSFSIGLGSSIAIVTITKANPGVVTTAAAHGLSTDHYVYFNQLGEMTEIEDNCYQITVIDSTSFSIIDTSAFTSAEADGGSEECFKADSYMVDPYDNMLTATLLDTDLGSIVIAVPYPSTSAKEIGTGETHTSWTAWLTAGGYPVLNDNINNTTAIAEAGAVDLSAYDGSSGNEIIINGNGYAWTNNLTFGDYYTLSRMIFGSTIVLNTGDTLSMSLVPTGDILQVATATATVNNVTIVGTFDIDATTTANNVAVPGTVALASGITLTATNCAFAESKATIEASGGTLTDTDCVFSVSDFHFHSATDYRLLWNSPCVKAGATITDSYDLRGRYIRPPYNIGCYQSRRIFTPWDIPLSTWSP